MEEREIIKLLDRAKANDQKAIEEIILRYNKLIYKIIYEINLSSLKEDAYQEALIALLKAIKRYDQKKGIKFITFLYTVVKRHIIRYRDNEKTHYFANENIENIKNIENTEIIDKIYNKILFTEILDKLNTKDKFFIELHYKKKLSLAEISKILNVSKQAVSFKKKQILSKIRRNYEDNNN